MSRIRNVLLSLLVSVAVGACGAVYRAHTEIRASRMLKSLHTGQSSLEVHQEWGEPDIRTYLDSGSQTEIWSYAEKPNTNDVTAALLYTAPKNGDSGRFLDLKFANGKLESWSEADHKMPEKEGGKFGYGVGSPVSNMSHY